MVDIYTPNVWWCVIHVLERLGRPGAGGLPGHFRTRRVGCPPLFLPCQLLVVLSEDGRGKRLRPGRAAEFDGSGHPSIASECWMLDERDHALRDHLRMIKHVLDSSRHGARDLLPEQLLPFQCGAREENSAQFRNDLGSVLRALAYSAVPWIVAKFRQPRLLAKRLPEVGRIR